MASERRWTRFVPTALELGVLGAIVARSGIHRDAERYVRKALRPPMRPQQPVPVLTPNGSRWWDHDGHRPSQRELVIYVKPRHVASVDTIEHLATAMGAVRPPHPILWVVCSRDDADNQRFMADHGLDGHAMAVAVALSRPHPKLPFAYTVAQGQRAAHLGSVIAHLGTLATADDRTRFFEACEDPEWADWWVAAQALLH